MRRCCLAWHSPPIGMPLTCENSIPDVSGPAAVRVASVTSESAWSAPRRLWIMSHEFQLHSIASHPGNAAATTSAPAGSLRKHQHRARPVSPSPATEIRLEPPFLTPPLQIPTTAALMAGTDSVDVLGSYDSG